MNKCPLEEKNEGLRINCSRGCDCEGRYCCLNDIFNNINMDYDWLVEFLSFECEECDRNLAEHENVLQCVKHRQDEH